MNSLKLSVCIATYNRGSFIRETLDTIIPQLTRQVELIIVDGASTDNTLFVMTEVTNQYPHVKYYRENKNSGVDRDYDLAVSYANGRYCWLMTDDDTIEPNAIQKILSEIDKSYDLILPNARILDSDLDYVLKKKFVDKSADIIYQKKDYNKLLAEMGNFLSFIGCVVIKKSVWLSRERNLFYGSLFIHVGVIFQNPNTIHALFIASPLINIRYGNAMWSSRSFEIWMFKWPMLIYSFEGYLNSAKKQVCHKNPWSNPKILLHQYALGAFNKIEFDKFIKPKSNTYVNLFAIFLLLLPGKLLNLLMVCYFLFKSDSRLGIFDLLRSKYGNAISRFVARTVFRGKTQDST